MFSAVQWYYITGVMFFVNRSALMQARAGRAGTGGTLGLTVTLTQTERGQRNEDGLGLFHEKTSRALVMLRSGGNYTSRFLTLDIYRPPLTHSC